MSSISDKEVAAVTSNGDNGTEVNDGAPADFPKDLEFLNEPAVGNSPSPASATGVTPTSATSPAVSSPPPTTQAFPGPEGQMTQGVLIGDGNENTNHQFATVNTPHSFGATTSTGGVDELPTGDVISVFDDASPEAGAPMITQAMMFVCCGILFATMCWPFIISKDSRLIDLVAIAVTFPACGAFLWVIKSNQSEFAHPRNVFWKFFIGWCIMLPIAWIAAFGCLFIGIISVALILGITGLGGWFAFTAITIVLVGAIIVPEECVKLMGAQRDNVRKNIQNPRQYVLYSLFAALGMATFEAYIMTHYIRRALDYGARKEASHYDAHNHKMDIKSHGGDNLNTHHHYITQSPGMTRAPESVIDALHMMVAQAVTQAPTSSGSGSGGGGGGLIASNSSAPEPDLVDATDFLVMFAMCLICIIPMHVLSGYHVGLGIARRDINNSKESVFRILVAPILFRSVFLYIIWFLPFITKWDAAGLVALLLIPAYVMLVKWDEQKMPRSYLLRSGYMNAFGYGVLPEDDEATQGEDLAEMGDDGEGQGGDNSNTAGTSNMA